MPSTVGSARYSRATPALLPERLVHGAVFAQRKIVESEPPPPRKRLPMSPGPRLIVRTLCDHIRLSDLLGRAAPSGGQIIQQLGDGRRGRDPFDG
jgi:hypothetical protein